MAWFFRQWNDASSFRHCRYCFFNSLKSFGLWVSSKVYFKPFDCDNTASKQRYRTYAFQCSRKPSFRVSGPSVAVISGHKSSFIRPINAKQFRLFQHRLCRLGLFVRRVAVSLEDLLDHHAKLGADAFFHGPVNGYVAADGVDQFTGDGTEGFVAEDGDGTVVDFEGL